MILLILTIVIALALCVYLFKRNNAGAEQNLCGKIALITGGSAGLGQQICIELASHGCNIIIADIASADETIQKLENFNVKVKAYIVDVSNHVKVEELKEKVKSDFGDIDLLINNAGLIPYKTLFEQSYESIEKLNSVNINAVEFMTKCFLTDMIQRGTGHIVSISSLQGIYAFPYSLTYSTSKFAVTGFMLGLFEFLRRENLHGINTTCILPNVIATRDDIIKTVNTSKFEMLQPRDSAKIIVNAIINGSRFVTIPREFGILIGFFNLLPFWAQHFYRDYIRNEGSFLNKI